MLREQRILKEVADKLGDELNEYIANFNKYSFWYFKEGEIIVNKTFKKILEIVASYNLTTAKIELGNVKDLELEELERLEVISLLCQVTKIHLDHGGEYQPLANKVALVCFRLHVDTIKEHITATKFINTLYETDLLVFEPHLITKIKYKLNKSLYPYRLNIDKHGIELISLLSGKRMIDVIKDLADVKILEME